MASGKGSRKGTSKNNSSRNTSSGRRKTTNSRSSRQSEPMDREIKNEVILIGVFALAVFLFLCNFGVVGVFGDAISSIMFGLFGLTTYIAPVLLFLAVAFGISNKGNYIAKRKLVAAVVLFILIGMFCDLMAGEWSQDSAYNIGEIYKRCSEYKNGGGVIAGSLTFLSYHFLSLVGTVLMIIVLAVICLVILTEKSLVSSVRNGGQRVYEKTREDSYVRKERMQRRRAEQEELRKKKEEELRVRQEESENEKILRMDKKVSGVMLDTAITSKGEEAESSLSDDIHEIVWNDFDMNDIKEVDVTLKNSGENIHAIDFDSIHITSASQIEMEPEIENKEDIGVWEMPEEEIIPAPVGTPVNRPVAKSTQTSKGEVQTPTEHNIKIGEKLASGKYVFPPLTLLQKSSAKGAADSTQQLKETAIHLQKTLATFGVKVTITDISQGPSVTRYEMQPEQGVKVSKIVGLADDIKLNLAATDIRIEAPIPGKAAVGIEVPNKENAMVMLRDLLESKEFKEFPSKLAFSVGKDIGGKTVVTDIARMPHMLIAGSTGSGKSVCINTLIMSILYKAHPDEVKLIMIDPKVVELSVYNGIPHLLIPVVTDPKKAAAALHWGVAEMTERYKQFADYNVRDLKGFNRVAQEKKDRGEADAPALMPQIVIIVDELADLMMVAPGEVEESICRLAQLARAAGIHLIIATQRPSVDVITGLIKANMPSRVAFAVSSGVDSRTILDMNGAEKLLGKGDMLFYPQGYPKPARVQGAFVSDKEVSDVVDYLKNQAIGNVYSEVVEEKIQSIGTGSASMSGPGEDGAGSRDQYFVDAGKFIIDKDKASIGMLQRVFKIGFNRAARIMDQLSEAGVVGEEEGTKPRKVLMSMEQFEQLIEEVL
ncbi:FtsK/SpoIIIE family DNA translocase [Kineothrix sp. MB12-C1]|uniref:FtsK/SpoIIIE family DNA translocase n=1 Tax=Kineothrix sp. MB12-C1 TaxID=3070215 RepID=UPI0027D2A8AE|nr:DNA translocase FtsK [Kineothrix sp. MB12-C1]WMC92465.1 DNA translocase FtsK [Kineothrix sp. MB12-C1]